MSGDAGESRPWRRLRRKQRRAAPGDDHLRRIAAIREGMRFEIGVFHDRINARISAEAVLLVSFTMALAYAGHGTGTSFFWISPTLSAVGFTLAALAWPGVATSHCIIVEWNVLFVDFLNAAHAASALNWRPLVFVDSDKRIHADHRRSMLFSRFVPAIWSRGSSSQVSSSPLVDVETRCALPTRNVTSCPDPAIAAKKACGTSRFPGFPGGGTRDHGCERVRRSFGVGFRATR